jgi:hypothetical protein
LLRKKILIKSTHPPDVIINRLYQIIDLKGNTLFSAYTSDKDYYGGIEGLNFYMKPYRLHNEVSYPTAIGEVKEDETGSIIKLDIQENVSALILLLIPVIFGLVLFTGMLLTGKFSLLIFIPFAAALLFYLFVSIFFNVECSKIIEDLEKLCALPLIKHKKP